MKNTYTSKLIIGALLTGIVISSGTGIVNADSTSKNQSEVSASVQAEVSTKYPSQVMEVVRVSLGGNPHSTELDAQISSMKKVDVLDRYMASFGPEVEGTEARIAVMGVFNIDLNNVSDNNYGSKLSIYEANIMKNVRESLNVSPESTVRDSEIMAMSKNEVMDRFMKNQNFSLTTQETKTLINNIYGVNLDGISGAEFARLGMHSKGQWVLQSDRDVFTLSSSNDDVKLFVAVTDYFIDKTGSSQFPDSLVQKLVGLGFTYDEVTGVYTYTNPTGESAPDALKGEVVGSLVNTIQTLYADL